MRLAALLLGLSLAWATSPVLGQAGSLPVAPRIPGPAEPSADPLPSPVLQTPTIRTTPAPQRQTAPEQTQAAPPIRTTPAPQRQTAPEQTQAAPPPKTPAPAARGTRTPAAEATAIAERHDEYQELVATSIGQPLPIFGHDLFADPPATFAPLDNIPVPADYVIGPGDELVVRAWGQIDVDYRAHVDRNGVIHIPRVGPVRVAGIRYQDLAAHVRAAIARTFRNFDVLVTLGELRSIQVFVVGHARRPGVYTLSSLSTLVNAVFAVGGPSTRGTMRAIQLRRGNRLLVEFDLYDLLLRGDKSSDVQLMPGDVIHFPPIGPLAAIAGSVNNPAIYELKGETKVRTLLELAGGLSTTALTQRATIERIENRRARTVDQFALEGDGLARPIRDGDLVRVHSISPRFENAVTLRGHVAMPLRYPHFAGMRVRDLVPEKEALLTPDYHRRRNLAARADSVPQGELAASVRRLADEINWDYAVVERLNPADLSTTLIPFNLGKAVLENDPAHNLLLERGDVVTVFSKADVAAPVRHRPVVVQLEGEFPAAGVYQARPGETLRQLVARVGGVTPQAYLFGAVFTRESTRREQAEHLERTIAQLEQDLRRAVALRARGTTTAADAAAAKGEAEAQEALLARLRKLQPTGRIALDIPENATVAHLPDIVLEDGDRFHVPQRPSQVSVFGAVFHEASFLHQPTMTVGDYLALAGGARREADRSGIFLLRANGSVVSERGRGLLATSLASFRPMPGDAIIVPEDFERTRLRDDLKDWTQIFYQFGLGAAALKVIR